MEHGKTPSVWVVFSAFYVNIHYYIFCGGKQPSTGRADHHDIFGKVNTDYAHAA